MSDSNGNATGPGQRRKSFVEMLNPRTFSNTSSMSTSPSNPIPTTSNTQNNRKSMSIALGLSGSGPTESPYNAFSRQRRASISSTSGSPVFRNSFDENAIIEDDDKVASMISPPSPSFARRSSFGAQALRDVRQGGSSPSGTAGRRPSSSLFTLNEDCDNGQVRPNPTSASVSIARSPGTAKTAGEGFNWSDAMMDRNRKGSISGNNPFGHNRAKSFNVPPSEPPKEMPKPLSPTVSMKKKKPDHLGERMLRGDFLMD